MAGVAGVIYAPKAQLVASGNAQLNAAVVVDTLSLSNNAVANALTLAAPVGTVAYTPAQIRTAYGIAAATATVPGAKPLDGTGQTIAIVDAYHDPDIAQAVNAFDAQFGLTSSGPSLYAQYGPASSFLTVVDQGGLAAPVPATDPAGPGTDNWELEESLDVEWAHAIAPGARIVVVETDSPSWSDLMAGVATAAGVRGVSVVSMSWGFAEGQGVTSSLESSADRLFASPGVTFLASTGDDGPSASEYPAFSPNVVAVGGTSLALSQGGAYEGETGWDGSTTSTRTGPRRPTASASLSPSPRTRARSSRAVRLDARRFSGRRPRHRRMDRRSV